MVLYLAETGRNQDPCLTTGESSMIAVAKQCRHMTFHELEMEVPVPITVITKINLCISLMYRRESILLYNSQFGNC